MLIWKMKLTFQGHRFFSHGEKERVFSSVRNALKVDSLTNKTPRSATSQYFDNFRINPSLTRVVRLIHAKSIDNALFASVLKVIKINTRSEKQQKINLTALNNIVLSN